MIKKFGNQVATSPNGVRWFVVDGDLWCDKSPSQIQLCGRWPDDLPFTASRLDGRPGYCEYCRGTNKAVGPDGTPYCVDCAKRFNKSVSERS